MLPDVLKTVRNILGFNKVGKAVAPSILQIHKELGIIKPIRAYHGTTKSFLEFDISKARGEYGHYFTTDPRLAERYGSLEGGNIRPVDLYLKKSATMKDIDMVAKEMNGLDVNKPIPFGFEYNNKSIVEELKRRGFDSLRIPNAVTNEGRADVYSVFNSDVIRPGFGRSNQIPTIGYGTKARGSRKMSKSL